MRNACMHVNVYSLYSPGSCGMRGSRKWKEKIKDGDIFRGSLFRNGVPFAMMKEFVERNSHAEGAGI